MGANFGNAIRGGVDAMDAMDVMDVMETFDSLDNLAESREADDGAKADRAGGVEAVRAALPDKVIFVATALR